MSEVGDGLRPAAREDLRALAVDVAPRLLGGVLVTDVAEERVVVRITEVEAYLGLGTGDVPDPGSHARMGPTARNATMWGEPGHLYVYLSHGIHSCVNVVAAPAGGAGGILLRADVTVQRGSAALHVVTVAKLDGVDAFVDAEVGEGDRWRLFDSGGRVDRR